MAKKATTSAADFLPARKTINTLREAAHSCRGCDLYKDALQTVFSSGPKDAALMIVGETPGKIEDAAGMPFSGPAGLLLRKTLRANGLNPDELYLTNTVKHFKFAWSGRKKIHKSPSKSQIKACSPWILEEINLIQPAIILCLGAIAATTLIDPTFRLIEQRGTWYSYSQKTKIIATYHPSAILRAMRYPDGIEMKAQFEQDIAVVATTLASY